MEESRGLYIISVAARLLEMHPQTLRKYEREGLIAPPRTMGMLRLYSAEDIARLRFIKHLVEDLELNLSGVALVLDITERLLRMRELATSTKGEEELRRRILNEVKDTLSLVGASS
jgi:MerR family transcriptional regulator/heat shock protein HspR